LKENSAVFKNIKNNYTINIQGTSQEVTKSKGRTSIEIQTSKYIIPHNFQIVNLEFAILCDGILGIDFIKKYNCQIGSKPSKDWLIIRTNNLKYPIYLPKTSSSGNSSTILPARSQGVRKNQLSLAEDSVLIPIRNFSMLFMSQIP